MLNRVARSAPPAWDCPQDAWDLPIDVGVNGGNSQSSVNDKGLSCERAVVRNPCPCRKEVLQMHPKREPFSQELITALRVAEFVNSL